MTTLEWTDISCISRDGEQIGAPKYESKVGVEAWFRIHGHTSTRSGRPYGPTKTETVAWHLSFIDLPGYCAAGLDYRQQGYVIFFAKDGKYRQDTDLFWEYDDKWFFDTLEEAQAHAEKVIGYLKRTYPKAFTEKVKTNMLSSGTDWVHDGYV